MTEIWQDRKIKSGYERAGDLAKRYNRRNYRKHPALQRSIVENSLDKLGWLGSIKQGANNVIFDGHLRVELALVKFGPDALVPVDYYNLTPEETDQALLIHDTTTGMADIDFVMLDTLWKETPALEIPEFDLWLGDFLKENGGLNGANGNGKEPEPEEPLIDKAEELQKVWQVQPGQVWQISQHRLICGDCRNEGDIARLLQGQKMNGAFTSPPYAEQRKKQYGGIPTAEYVQWWDAVQANVRANLAGDGSFFVNIKPHCEGKERSLYVFDLVCAMVRQWQWCFIDELCWYKNGFPGSFSYRFRDDFEPVFHFSIAEPKFRPYNVGREENQTHNFHSAFNLHQGEGVERDYKRKEITSVLPGNVLKIGVEGSQLGHQAAFPVSLPTFFVKAYSDSGDSWLDPFAGSGTTGIAAGREKRVAYLCEVLPKYCSVILQRFKNEGHDPRLVSG